MLPFDSSCESSLAVFEQLVRSLPNGGFPLPEPMAPKPEVYQAWMERYEGWKIPTLYSELIQKYGGVRESFPPTFWSIEPIETLLRYRLNRDAIRERFNSKFILLSHAHINGNLCLMFRSGIDNPPVAFFNGDEDIVIESDTLGMYLWSTYFSLNCIDALPNNTIISLRGNAEPGAAFQVLHSALVGARFLVHGFDSKQICATRDRTSIFCYVKKDRVDVSIASTSVFDDLGAVERELRELFSSSTD
jgi:hypothetical protein